MANLRIESRAIQTERAYREIVEKDRVAVAAKTTRLRALRLASEAKGVPPVPPVTERAKKAAKRRRDA